MKIFIASDHAGFNLKKTIYENLKSKGIEILDLGVDSKTLAKLERVDYPDYAKALCKKMQGGAQTNVYGILVCGSGIGMNMSANRFSNIRAVVCAHPYMAKMARAHNDANVLCLGERFVGIDLALEIVDTFLNTSFEGGRHTTRVQKID